jgi:hypothetical protein
LNLVGHILALLDDLLASLMILLGLFDSLAVLLFDINLSNFGSKSRAGRIFSLVNCVLGSLISIFKLAKKIFELPNQDGRVDH